MAGDVHSLVIARWLRQDPKLYVATACLSQWYVIAVANEGNDYGKFHQVSKVSDNEIGQSYWQDDDHYNLAKYTMDN